MSFHVCSVEEWQLQARQQESTSLTMTNTFFQWMTPITLPSSEITNERMDVRRIEDNVRRIEQLCNVVQRVEAKDGSMKSKMFVVTLVVVMLIFVIVVK